MTEKVTKRFPSAFSLFKSAAILFEQVCLHDVMQYDVTLLIVNQNGLYPNYGRLNRRVMTLFVLQGVLK